MAGSRRITNRPLNVAWPVIVNPTEPSRASSSSVPDVPVAHDDATASPPRTTNRPVPSAPTVTGPVAFNRPPSTSRDAGSARPDATRRPAVSNRPPSMRYIPVRPLRGPTTRNPFTRFVPPNWTKPGSSTVPQTLRPRVTSSPFASV